jgi:hypothetical protein
LCYLAVSNGRATSAPALPPEAPALEAILSEARLSLAEARKTHSDPGAAVGWYLQAADKALRAAGESAGNQASEARLIYDRASEEVTVLLWSNHELWNKAETIAFDKGSYQLRFAAGSSKDGTWDPTYFDLFRTQHQVHEKISRQTASTDAWGGILVGVHKPPDPRRYLLPSVGIACPVTVILDFRPSGTATTRTREVTLLLYDPTRRSTVRLADAQRPLAADFAAPLAYYPEPGLRLGVIAMMRPQNYEQRAGLYMLEPYDPDRIPVIFIHGLISVPQQWIPTIAAVESDPLLHSRYQFWTFAYPTGDPILISSLKLRESLELVYKLYPKTKDTVLISYSLGGLLAHMQAVTTGRVLWDDVFQSDADRLYTALPPDNLMKRAMIFEANPRVRRIVFVCVPHRGTNAATNWVGSTAVGLIRLPGKILERDTNGAMATLQKNVGLKHPPTGINGLSPRSPVLRGLDTLNINAPYHSIIGDRGRGDTPNSSDGVVAYWSSHLAGAQSELIVPGSHGSFALPQTVSELKRILRLNLSAASAPHRKTTPRGQHLAARTNGDMDREAQLISR